MVEWQVQGNTSKLQRYRVVIVETESEAKALVASLRAQAQAGKPGAINPTGVFDPLEIDFFNRKSFVRQFVNTLCAIPSVID
jgi:hypothetical protein